MNKENEEKITINDVATMAKVSKTTISRYLNGHFQYMSMETRDRIQKVIEELDYRPSNIARSLKAKNTGVIGCIIADIGNPFSSIVVKGINDVCNNFGYNVLFANTDNNSINEIESIQSLMDNKVDGLIINTTGKNDDYLLDLKNKGMKIVLVDRCLKNKDLIDTVETDNYKATYDCIEYLFNQGYKKIAFFTEDISDNSSRYLRYYAYKDAMKKFYNIETEDLTYIIEDYSEKGCKESLIDFKEKCKGEHGAIFTVNGVTLLNVLHSMKEINMEIVEDFGICGFDDWGWASLIGPGITTITQNSYECGVQCAKMLINRIKDENYSEPRCIELPANLVKRGSTNLKKGIEKNE